MQVLNPLKFPFLSLTSDDPKLTLTSTKNYIGIIYLTGDCALGYRQTKHEFFHRSYT